MNKKTAKEIIAKLSENFSDKPALNFTSAYELLISVILSAQCKDERVNRITAELFKEYNTPKEMLKLSQAELEKKIYSCGLYRTKAEHILALSTDILEKFNGEVPNNLAELQSLDGVGRKTANVVYSVWFKGSAIAVDTHVFRVSNRIGLANANNVLSTEKNLMEILDKTDWSRSHHYLIYLGRSFCVAGKHPKCESCPIEKMCEKNIKEK